MRIYGIDPGTTESGIALVNEDYEIEMADKVSNDILIQKIKTHGLFKTIDQVVVESIQSYGMQMGKSTIETCYFIGQIIQVCKDNNIPCKLIPRPEYGKAVIGSNKVNDALIRTALENRFGSYDKGKAEKRLKNGTIKQPFVADGPLVELQGASDKRSAYAVAVYWIDVYGGKNV